MENYELLKRIARSLLEDPEIYQGIIKSIPSDKNFYAEDESITLEDIAFLYLLEKLEEIAKEHKGMKHA